MIEYRPQANGSVRVYLEGYRAGTIVLYPLGWQYRTIGGVSGAFYPTLAECKASLEDDDEPPPATSERK